MQNLVVAVSGGKDSTALALRLSSSGHAFRLLHTATGNELPGVREHILRVATECNAPLIDLAAPTLAQLIAEQQCLPNWRMRWCTRMIKIEPVAAWLLTQEHPVLAVGLRADEDGRAGATYAAAEIRYPLREWGWRERDVLDYCDKRGFTPPPRTDCAVCFYQTLYEWWSLWRNYPAEYSRGEQWEAQAGHTFRSPQRDTQPAALRDLRQKFEAGYVPTRRQRKQTCRVCSL